MFSNLNLYLPPDKQSPDNPPNWLPIICPECGSQDTGTNLFDELVCNSCGYDEQGEQF